jgi:hypothetical protein
LQEILKALSLEFVGRHHSGLDDCYSILQVVEALLQRGTISCGIIVCNAIDNYDTGHQFAEPTKIPADYDHTTDSNYECDACFVFTLTRL